MTAKNWLKNLFVDNIALPWVIIFLLINIIARGTGGHNEGARLATLRAMSEQGSFVINKYEWGDDWSINKKGEKFANKAPGPMFLGFPVYFVIDTLFKNHEKATIDKDGHNTTRLRATPRAIFSIIMQVIPFALFMLWLSKKLLVQGLSTPAVHFSMLALLFGNTSSIFMNTYFGHGMAGAFAIALTYSLYVRNYRMVGLFYGLTLLSEYAAALVFPPLLFSLIYLNRTSFKWIKDLFIGGLVPGLLWCWYHISSFGSPFSTAIQHENPLFFQGKPHDELLFGMFDIPKIEILIKLLFGTERGLLFTQPWILFFIFVIPIIFRKSNSCEDKSVLIFSWSSLFLMILMNSSFNGWHGGLTSGPRYLAISLAPIGLVLPYFWTRLPSAMKSTFWLLLAISIEFRAGVFATTIMAPVENLWLFQWDIIFSKNKHLLRFIVFHLIFGIAIYKIIKNNKLH
ncbi:MAG: hypothetical protein EP319_07780, partial [Deltaproteobacteria bacterium]